MSILKHACRSFGITVLTTVFFITTFYSIDIQAQALEEIVVTAQRREQSLQDVPISIDIYSADMIQEEGFNNLEELSAFSPGVFVNEGGDQGSDVFIRGFGTVGRNWANDSATPLFLDNVNLGQASMGAIGFMDTQRVEILKGPQPIHFGLNATGGALSIVSARPTQEWDGYARAEVGMTGDWTLFKRFGNTEVEGAVGGPISETLAFRVAGRYSSRDGHLRDAVTGFPMGYRNFAGARLSLQWAPTDKLTVFSKLEIAEQRWQSTDRVCRRPQDDYPNRFERRQPPTFDQVETDPTGVWLSYAEGGSGWNTPFLGVDTCGDSYEYIGQTTAYEQPTVGVRTRDTATGFPDIRLAAATFLNEFAGGNWRANPTTFGESNWAGFKGDGGGLSEAGYQEGQTIEPKNFQVDLNYRFDNNIEIQWINNYMNSYYTDFSVGRNTPYVENIRNRVEDYEQYSSELRISSFGDNLEWMLGAFVQKENLDFTTIDMRAEIRFNNRMNVNGQDATWTSYFGNLTYNFYQDRLSVDAGLRLSKVRKDPFLNSYNSSWIYDVTPCRGDGAANADAIWRGDTTDWGGLPVQDVTPADCLAGLEPEAERIDPADAIFLIDSLQNRNVNTDNLWFVPRSRERDVPSTWRGSYTAAVGITPWSTEQRPGEQWSNIARTWDNWDPQIVLRYRPNPELSTYFKYATAFKAGAFDLGFGGSQPSRLDPPPGGLEELTIDPEFSETYEFGAAGTYFEGRGRFQATLFRVDFDDLIATTVTSVGTDDQSTQVINIGSQRAQGLEFDSQVAWSDQLTLGVNLTYLDSKFTFFPNANCTEHEVRNAPGSGCQIVGDPEDPDAAVIDRTGQTAPYAPEFSGVVHVDYWMPFRGYKVDFGGRLTAQTDYFTDFREFDKSTVQEAAADLNLHVGISDMDEVWRVALSARNLLEPRESFRPEFTSGIFELGGASLRTNQVKSIALTFKYNFFR